MNRQLEFWGRNHHQTPIWKTLAAEDKEKVTALLARILSQVVQLPPPNHPIQENPHELS